MNKNLTLILAIFLLFVATDVDGQETVTLTDSDYARAEKMLRFTTAKFVDRSSVRPTWLSDGRLWYRVLTATGSEYVLINPATGERKTASDSKTLIGSSSNMAGGNNRRRGSFLEITSPDKKKVAFIRKHNLWVRDIATKKETQLTKNGAEDFGYATDNAGWKHSPRPVLKWSPDSRKIATFQQDQRGVSDMYLVTTNVGKPRLSKWKYPLPGDKIVTTIQRVILEIATQKVIRLKMPADEHRSTICDDISCGGSFDDVEWNADASKLAFVSSSRDHKKASLRIADARTGVISNVFEEVVETQYESGQGMANWRYLPESNEIIWFSERDDWGHLYLYNLSTGKLKHQITKGDFAIQRLRRVDTKNRVLYFEANGREKGRDPYFSHFYRVDFSGKNLKLLTPEDGNHRLSFSPDGKYFVDNYSQPNVPPVAVLRDMTGTLRANLEKADISRLVKTGWKPPMPITVRSSSGKYDLHGLMFTSKNMDSKKKHPIINYIYPGPQAGGVGSRSFSPSRSDHQALAELGFVVIVIDGACNPSRSKSYHDSCYGDMADNTLPDQIAGIKELAAKYSFIDIDRVGIWGHSGGGFATAAAMFRYPDFYKVGISESGNHDNRNYEDDWGERYIGLLKGDNYKVQANQIYAKNLKGKLLLAHGGMDDNVPPYNTYLVVDALIKANKDFDLIIFPNARHGYGRDSLYMMRRRWDYFVTHLMGATPPKGYQIKLSRDPRLSR